jgi:hypothetical protein
VAVTWNLPSTGGIHRWYNLKITGFDGRAIAYTTTADRFKVLTKAEIRDSVRVYVEAENYKGRSGYADPAGIYFVRGPGVPPPPANSDLPFGLTITSDLSLVGFTRSGCIYAIRSFDFGSGLYIWNSWFEKVFELPKGQITVSAYGNGYLTNDILTITAGGVSQIIPLVQNMKRDSTVHVHSRSFYNANAGPVKIRWAATNARLTRIAVRAEGEDLLLPDKPVVSAKKEN